MAQIAIPTPLVFFEEGASEPATVFEDATVYYAEIPFTSVALKTSVAFDYDATIVADADFEVSNDPEADLTAVAGRSWAATTITTVAIAGGTAGAVCGHYADNLAARARIKLAVATGTTLAGLNARAHHKY